MTRRKISASQSETGNSAEMNPTSPRFSSTRTRKLFEYLVNSFVEDYMRKKYLQEKSGWRSLVQAARETGIPARAMYGKSGGFGHPVNELVRTGFVEVRVFPGSRGRGGEAARLRIAYERKPVQAIVDRLVVGGKQESSEPRTLDKRRVAILPLVNIGEAPDEYLADGLTEELITTLSKIGGLSVISRTSVMQYKRKAKSLTEIGMELNAGTVVEGSIRRAGNTIRVTIQANDSMKDEHLWAEKYDRELQDIFAIQNEIALRVAEVLRIKLLLRERGSIEKTPTQSIEAYDSYLQGRFYFRMFTKEGLDKSLESYRQALEKDPKFAMAYGGMAATYQWYGFLNILPEKEAYPKARELAERALELDDSLAECHYILGRILLEHFWAIPTGEAELVRSIKLNPNDARVRLAYSWLLASRLQSKEAIAETERAVQLDPKSAEAWWSGSATHYFLSNFDKGAEYGLKAIELNPLDPLAHMLTRMNLVYAEQPEEAIKQELEAVALSSDQVYFRSILGFVYGIAGKRPEARRVLNDMIRISKKQHVAPMLFAWVYAGLGEVDRYLNWLQKAYEERSSFLVYTINEPYTAELGVRSDPRFKAIMGKVGLAKWV